MFEAKEGAREIYIADFSPRGAIGFGECSIGNAYAVGSDARIVKCAVERAEALDNACNGIGYLGLVGDITCEGLGHTSVRVDFKGRGACRIDIHVDDRDVGSQRAKIFCGDGSYACPRSGYHHGFTGKADIHDAPLFGMVPVWALPIPYRLEGRVSHALYCLIYIRTVIDFVDDFGIRPKKRRACVFHKS